MMETNEKSFNLSGVLKKVLYKNDETKYTIAVLENNQKICGVYFDADIEKLVGEEILLTGNWITHSKYGVQFEFNTLQVKEHELFFFLTKIIKGFTKKSATEILEKYGEEGLIKILDENPNELLNFKVTEGFVKQYGNDRVRNTTLCESAIIGIALGLSLKQRKSMVEMQFADFVTCGFNQIVNNLAKIHYRWGANADVVVRMPTGAGVGAGPFHSQSNEAWFAHTPGLKVVYPSNPADAKGLLLSSFEDPNPVIFFEHKGLYRSLSGMVPEGYYTTPIGKAASARQGTQATIITYGMGVHWALHTAEEMGVDVEIIDLRTLLPIDFDTIADSVIKTNRVIILHEDTMFGGIGGEISAWINENLFKHLDAPVMRCASLDTPVPFAIELEKMFLPTERFKEKLQELLNY
ncbi:MAG TPA: alpha-ketoacid dehydrogenase subunit beta [Saprospiraceae bacterium]|nr:alpha-ketoacid dehydrogenase subunit beta [Saprospiraceae bacterium]